MTRKLTVAHLTAIDLAPPALIEASAAAGFDGVGLRLVQVTPDSPGYPLSSPGELAATRRAMAATGLVVADIEFLKITPDYRPDSFLAALDAGAELGERHVIAAPYDEDPERLAASMATLSDAARARGLSIVLEFFPWTPVPDLATCLRTVQRAGPEIGILVDALHFDRSDSTLAQLAAVPPERLPFAHFCDADVHPPYTIDELFDTARRNRLPPGEGEIGLVPFLHALPADLPLALEVPGTGAEGLAHLHAAATAVCGHATASMLRS